MKKHMVLVLNKVDLAPVELVTAWKAYLKEKYPQLDIVCFTSRPKDIHSVGSEPGSGQYSLLIRALLLLRCTLYSMYCIQYTLCPEKRGHVIFDYNSRLSWWILIIFLPLETGMNIAQWHIIYLLNDLMPS